MPIDDRAWGYFTSAGCGESIRSIATRLHRAPSTVSREIQRNGGSEHYRASEADQRAGDCARCPKVCKFARHRVLARLVAGKLQQQWSPEQIAGWLKRTYSANGDRQVSHETIYMRRSRHHAQKTDNHGEISDMLPISKRPAEAEDRAVPVHWEGDLLFGDRNSQIATLVERQTRYVVLVEVTGKDTETVVNALIEHTHHLPQELYRSLTWDRG